MGIALTFLINYEKKDQKLTEEPVKTKFNIKTLFEKTALKPSLYQIFLAFGMSAIMTFIPIYGESRGVKNIGVFFTFYAGSTVLVSLLTGKLVKKSGIRKIFIPGWSCSLLHFYSWPLLSPCRL